MKRQLDRTKPVGDGEDYSARSNRMHLGKEEEAHLGVSSLVGTQAELEPPPAVKTLASAGNSAEWYDSKETKTISVSHSRDEPSIRSRSDSEETVFPVPTSRFVSLRSPGVSSKASNATMYYSSVHQVQSISTRSSVNGTDEPLQPVSSLLLLLAADSRDDLTEPDQYRYRSCNKSGY
ncbi:hypothetical protein RRG08_054895 [Elysia crispata]|uniref:Uncharacterized protein n=1 Tax=Elysia crispata TaxID=231223 RepID=A0AAE1A6V1_9GAST|nr:hypothetical protein RRG08_054895 [Elysia crispata]